MLIVALCRDVCRDQAVEHGEQLLPLINIYLDRKKPKQLQAVVWALQSLVYCVEEEVMDIQAGNTNFILGKLGELHTL
jgi:hypothetical protein